MNTVRLLSIGLAVAAGLLLVSGSLGFSSTTADRAISVDVADDESAFIGYNTTDKSEIESGETIEIVDISNRFAQEVEVTDVGIVTDDNDIQFGPPEYPTISSGEAGRVRADVTSCRPAAEAEVTATVTVTGDTVSATVEGDSETIERSFTVTCAAGNSSSQNSSNQRELVEYTGNGDAKITGGQSRNATVTYVDTDGNEQTQTGEFKPNKNLKNQVKENTGNIDAIACVEIDGTHYGDSCEES